jgi:hypothetical protein
MTTTSPSGGSAASTEASAVRRPFQVRSTRDAPDGVLQVRIDFASSLTPAAAERAMRAGEHYANLANAGALCGDTIAPLASGIDDARMSTGPGHADWLYGGVKIDPRGVSVLLNMVHALHERHAAVRAVHMAWQGLDAVDDRAEIVFPKIATPLPYAFSYDQDAAAFDIILDFQEPQDERTLVRVNETLGHWLCAVDAGAYGDESSLPALNRVCFAPDDPCMLDPGSLVWSIERFCSTRHALAGMVNVVSKIHQTLAPITLLEISE